MVLFTSGKPALVMAFFLIFACPAVLLSQKTNPLINSGELLEKGNKLHEEGKYKEAIEAYSQISRSDTNYSSALYELGYSCYSDKQFQRGLENVKTGLKLFPAEFTKFALIAGSILDEMDSSTQAIAMYSEALKHSPNAAIVYFNRAVVYVKSKQVTEARKDLEQCLLINPYYGSAHYYIGTLYYDEGNMVAAMLAFKTYLLVSPSGRYLNTVIQKLSNMAKVTDEVLENVKKYKPGKEDNFDLQQQILLSKIALDKNYKLKVDLEDQIVRQVQVVDEKLEYIKNDRGFCMQYYVPFYSKVFKEGYFEPMIFSVFSGLDIKSIKEWMKRNKKEQEAFGNYADTYLGEIRDSRVLTATERKNAPVWHLFEGGKFVGKGGYKMNAGKKDLFGPWEFYYENGKMSAKGSYNDAEEKTGEWIYYYNNGQVKQKTVFKNNVEEGLSEGWFRNGNRWFSENFVNGKVEGNAQVYYFNDMLKNSVDYKGGNKNGVQKNYNSKGDLLSIQHFTDDKLNGEMSTYHSNGKLDEMVNYVDDKPVGIYKSYYDDGVLEKQGEFTNGERQGLWTSYYANGNVKDKTTYANGEITGEFTEYHDNGKLSSKGTYNKKKIDGLVEYYDDDGIKYSDALYEKGRLREINSFDKKGNNIYNSTTRRGAANITFYSPDGIKKSEGYFDKDGDKQGKFTYYYASGKINSEINYKDGVEDGPSVYYYNNGQKKLERNYSNGQEDGYTKEYFHDGKLSYEGWVINGEKQQHLVYYNEFGDLKQKVFYKDDDLDGYTEFLEPGNIKSYDYHYTNGWIDQTIQYDTTGRIISDNKLERGSGPVVYHHENGKILGTGAFKNYMLTGPYMIYFFDGTVKASSFYKKDERDSTFKEYYYGGVLKAEGTFKDGNRTGIWKEYYDNGKMRSESNYKNGNFEGPETTYNEDGTKDKQLNHKNGELDGEYKMFGENNQLALVLYYKEGALTGYSYEDKTGKLVPQVPLKGGSGKVTSYYKNGTQSAEIHFLDHVVQGTRKIFFSNGRLYIDGVREIGYDNGVKKIYYPSGTLMKEENLVTGDYHGSRKTYHPNGKTEKEENFYNDELHGTCRYYDALGKLKQTRKYFHGTLLSVQ